MARISRAITSWDKTKFREWLIQQAYSDKVAGDCISRCVRVEKKFNVDLIEATKNNDSYDKLLREIKAFSSLIYEQPRARYAASSTLKHSVKQFAKYYWNIQY